MGQVHPLGAPAPADSVPTAPAVVVGPQASKVRSIDSAHCGLCGGKLSTRSLRYHMVSPQTSDEKITVCHVCRKAALGEGYRPVE